MKRIIFISEMPITNGVIQAQLLPVVFESKKNGYAVSVIETIGRFDSQEKYREKAEEELKKDGIFPEKIIIPRHTFLPSILQFFFKSLRVLKKIIRENKNDKILIYARNYKMAPALLWARYFWKINFIYSPRGAYVAERKHYRKMKDILFASPITFLEKRAILKSLAAILETEYLRKYIEETYGLNNGNLVVIPNFYDAKLLPPPEWDREKMRTELGFEGKKVIAYAGTVEVWYEFEKMFELVKRLKEKDPRIFFQLFLKEDYARDESKGMPEKLKKIALEKGLEEKRDFGISSFPPFDRYLYLSACDAGICLTTPQKFKAVMLYLKIVDYLGAKLPIIVNRDVLAAKEIIEESNAGFLVDYENWDKSISLFDSKDFFEKEKKNIEKYSSLNVIPLYLGLFKKVFDSTEDGNTPQN